MIHTYGTEHKDGTHCSGIRLSKAAFAEIREKLNPEHICYNEETNEIQLNLNGVPIRESNWE